MFHTVQCFLGFIFFTCPPCLGGSDGKSMCLQCGRPRFNPWVGKIPWRKKWQPTPVLLPRKSHGQRSLVQATVHVFLLFLVLFGVISQNALPNSESQKFSSVFSSKKFVVLVLKFRSELLLFSHYIKKIRDSKGTFQAKVGTIKDRNVWT